MSQGPIDRIARALAGPRDRRTVLRAVIVSLAGAGIHAASEASGRTQPGSRPGTTRKKRQSRSRRCVPSCLAGFTCAVVEGASTCSCMTGITCGTACCAAGEACRDGACVPREQACGLPGSACGSKVSCCDGTVCAAGPAGPACLGIENAPCEADDGCAPGLECRSAACRPALPPAPAHWAATPGEVRTVRVLDRTSAEWDGVLAAAAERWNAVLPAIRLEVTREPGPCDPVEGAIVACSPWDPGSWSGGAFWRTEGERHPHITAATTLFNDRVYAGRYPSSSSPARQALACHELGHALGLPHGDVPYDGCVGTVRDPLSIEPGEQDRDRLGGIYATCR